MKKSFLIYILLISSSFVMGQKEVVYVTPDLPIDETTKLVTYKDVINEKGSPQELYDRAMEWVKTYYKNTAEVIKTADREKGLIEIRSGVKIHNKMKDGSKVYKNVVYYNFKLECRQDRYRYTITDFNEKAAAAAPIEIWFDQKHSRWQPSWYDYLNEIHENMQSLIISLQDGMMPKPVVTDDW
ncbi:MAG: DUF4468 domain-containing protein [Bacteroidales bacterium]|nr:DUF4468 domain-containing protein [Bacteroidales bacterium]